MNRKILFIDVLNEWLLMKKLSIEKITYINYQYLINEIYLYFGNINIKKINTLDLQKYYISELERGVSAKTIKHKHDVIRPALNYAVNELHIIKKNPALSVKMPKKQKYFPDVLSEKEIKFILKKVQNTILELPIFMGAIYGLRRSEIVGLKWSAFNFENMNFIINNSILRFHKQIIEKPYGKTSSSLRILPIIPELNDILIRIQEKRKKDNIKSDYLCLDDNNKLINPNYITITFQKILKKYNLKHVRFHDLRHFCATFLYNNNTQMKDIQYWLGHSDIQTTMNIYTHLCMNNKKETAEKMRKIFKNNNILKNNF